MTGLTINVIKPKTVTVGAKLPVVIVSLSPSNLSCFFKAYILQVVSWRWAHFLRKVLIFHPAQQGGWETGAAYLCVLGTSYQVH